MSARRAVRVAVCLSCGGAGDDFIDGGLNIDSIRGDGGFDTCRSGEQRMSSCEA